MLARGLGILRVFRAGESELTFSDISRRANMPKATAHRIIAELVSEGMLERSEKGFRLGMGLFMLGARVHPHMILRNMALPYEEKLQHLTRGSTFLYIANSTGANATLDSVRNTHGHAPEVSMEEARAAYRAATRALRAFCAEGKYVVHPTARTREDEAALVRRQGFAVVREMTGVGVTGIAAPVLTAPGTAIGALAIAGPRARLDVGLAAMHLKAACAAVSRALQRTPELVTPS
ncbi:IclR family transcriptional regulator [Streptomyces sp. NPDC050121]|uniref:IclR family transcriptional regulator n=1 Tax=Streptomyces sp. NPDC050121 TaxID=3365601 RepID=UPI0037B951AB